MPNDTRKYIMYIFLIIARKIKSSSQYMFSGFRYNGFKPKFRKLATQAGKIWVKYGFLNKSYLLLVAENFLPVSMLSGREVSIQFVH